MAAQILNVLNTNELFTLQWFVLLCGFCFNDKERERIGDEKLQSEYRCIFYKGLAGKENKKIEL